MREDITTFFSPTRIVFQITGIPLHGIARSQINLVMKDMRGYNDKVIRFSNMTIPLVWLEYVSMSRNLMNIFLINGTSYTKH